jgi:hypothetical protein
MARRFFLLAILPAALWAQEPALQPLVAAYPQLKQYFGLSDTQVGKIQGLNSGFQLYLAMKYARVTQIQKELTIETAKTALDPLALGVRYTELELICREATRTQSDLVKNVQAVLTAAQQPKWQALQDAYKLLPVIQEGQQANLLPGAYSSGTPSASGLSSLLLGGSSTLPGCRSNTSFSISPVFTVSPFEDGPRPGAQ